MDRNNLLRDFIRTVHTEALEKSQSAATYFPPGAVSCMPGIFPCDSVSRRAM